MAANGKHDLWFADSDSRKEVSRSIECGDNIAKRTFQRHVLRLDGCTDMCAAYMTGTIPD